MMKEHIAYINQFCKLCKSSVYKASARHYNIKTYVSEINFMYIEVRSLTLAKMTAIVRLE